MGTEPVIRIGHREYRQRDGTVIVCKTWYADWCFHGKPGARSLRTRDEALAIERAIQLRVLLLTPEALRPKPLIGFSTLAERYLEYQRQRDHAPRTVQKYDLVLRELSNWAAQHGLHDITQFNEGSYWAFHAGCSMKA